MLAYSIVSALAASCEWPYFCLLVLAVVGNNNWKFGLQPTELGKSSSVETTNATWRLVYLKGTILEQGAPKGDSTIIAKSDCFIEVSALAFGYFWLCFLLTIRLDILVCTVVQPSVTIGSEKLTLACACPPSSLLMSFQSTRFNK